VKGAGKLDAVVKNPRTDAQVLRQPGNNLSAVLRPILVQEQMPLDQLARFPIGADFGLFNAALADEQYVFHPAAQLGVGAWNDFSSQSALGHEHDFNPGGGRRREARVLDCRKWICR